MNRPMEYPPVVKRLLAAAGEVTVDSKMDENVALVKLMWVLGHTKDVREIARLMTTNLAGEINPAISLQEYEGQ